MARELLTKKSALLAEVIAQCEQRQVDVYGAAQRVLDGWLGKDNQ